MRPLSGSSASQVPVERCLKIQAGISREAGEEGGTNPDASLGQKRHEADTGPTLQSQTVSPALVSQHGCFSNTCFGASLTYPTLPPWQRKMSALNLVCAVADVLSSFPGLTNFSSLASASSTRPHKFNLRARSGSLGSNCKAYWRWRRNVTHKEVQAYTHATTDRRRS